MIGEIMFKQNLCRSVPELPKCYRSNEVSELGIDVIETKTDSCEVNPQKVAHKTVLSPKTFETKLSKPKHKTKKLVHLLLFHHFLQFLAFAAASTTLIFCTQKLFWNINCLRHSQTIIVRFFLCQLFFEICAYSFFVDCHITVLDGSNWSFQASVQCPLY